MRQRKTEEFAECVEDWVEHGWTEGAPRNRAADVICGLQHFSPRLKGELKGPWRLLTSWQGAEIPCRANPMALKVLLALLGLALCEANATFAVTGAVVFFGLTRLEEVFWSHEDKF